MTVRSSGKSHAVAWVVLLLAVPVLYLLSCTPLVILIRGRPSTPPPQWLELYTTPAQWVYENTPLKGPLTRYSLWWLRRAGWRK